MKITRQKAIPDAEADMKKEEVEPFCDQVIQSSAAVRDGEDQEVDQSCDQVIQGPAAERYEEEEVEPLSEGMVTVSEEENNRKEKQLMPLCEDVIPAAEKMGNKDVQEEPVEHDQKYLLFDLPNEEEDVEGVELGEEELGENDYIWGLDSL